MEYTQPIWHCMNVTFSSILVPGLMISLTGNLSKFAPYATVAHIDIDPAEIGKNVPTAIPVVGDASRHA